MLEGQSGVNMLEGQSGVNTFSLEVGAEDCKKRKRNYLRDYKHFNVYIKCTATILSESLTDNRHNTVPKAKTQDRSKSLIKSFLL